MQMNFKQSSSLDIGTDSRHRLIVESRLFNIWCWPHDAITHELMRVGSVANEQINAPQL